MPDIDPAALSRPTVKVTSPALSNASFGAGTASVPGSAQKPLAKMEPMPPPRIDIEPIYRSLRSTMTEPQWVAYKGIFNKFLIGQVNQAEFSFVVDPILSQTAEATHLHNQIIVALISNVTREPPQEAGPAVWVSQNQKPAAALPKAPAGDTNEARLKTEVMHLPARDRRRLKDVASNEYDPNAELESLFATGQRRAISSKKPQDTPAGVAPGETGLEQLNLDLEIRKKYNQPLAVESGEFPTRESIEQRMRPICYEHDLISGFSPETAQLVSVATETYMRNILSNIFSATRSNGPGESGTAGFGVAPNWIQTKSYKKQLTREENQWANAEITRDKSGLLPSEAKAAHDRRALTMGDVNIGLEVANNGMTNFPSVSMAIRSGYREGDLERYGDYTTYDADTGTFVRGTGNIVYDGKTQPKTSTNGVNGHDGGDPMDIDEEPEDNPWGNWDGAGDEDMENLRSELGGIFSGT